MDDNTQHSNYDPTNSETMRSQPTAIEPPPRKNPRASVADALRARRERAGLDPPPPITAGQPPPKARAIAMPTANSLSRTNGGLAMPRRSEIYPTEPSYQPPPPETLVSPITGVETKLLSRARVFRHYMIVIPGIYYRPEARLFGECDNPEIKEVFRFLFRMVEYLSRAKNFMRFLDRLREAAEAEDEEDPPPQKTSRPPSNATTPTGEKQGRRARRSTGKQMLEALAQAVPEADETPQSRKRSRDEDDQRGKVYKSPEIWYEIVPPQQNNALKFPCYVLHIFGLEQSVDVIREFLAFYCRQLELAYAKNFEQAQLLRMDDGRPGPPTPQSMTLPRADRILGTYMRMAGADPPASYPDHEDWENMIRLMDTAFSPTTAATLLKKRGYHASALEISPTGHAYAPTLLLQSGKTLKEAAFIRYTSQGDNPLDNAFPDVALSAEAAFVADIVANRFKDDPGADLDQDYVKIMAETTNIYSAAFKADDGAMNSERHVNDVFHVMLKRWAPKYEELQRQLNRLRTRDEYEKWRLDWHEFSDARFEEYVRYIICPGPAREIRQMMSPPVNAILRSLYTTRVDPNRDLRLLWNRRDQKPIELKRPDTDPLASFIVYLVFMAVNILHVGKQNLCLFLALIIGGLSQFNFVANQDDAHGYNIYVEGPQGSGKSFLMWMKRMLSVTSTWRSVDSQSAQSDVSDTLHNGYQNHYDECPTELLSAQSRMGSQADRDVPLQNKLKKILTEGKHSRRFLDINEQTHKRQTVQITVMAMGVHFVVSNHPGTSLDAAVKTRFMVFAKAVPTGDEIHHQRLAAQKAQKAHPEKLEDFNTIMKDVQTLFMLTATCRNVYGTPPVNPKSSELYTLALDKMLKSLEQSNSLARENIYASRTKDGVMVYAGVLSDLQGWLEWCMWGPGFGMPFKNEWIREVAALQFPRLQAIVLALCIHIECFTPHVVRLIIEGLFRSVVPIQQMTAAYFEEVLGVLHCPMRPVQMDSSLYIAALQRWMHARYETKSTTTAGTSADGQQERPTTGGVRDVRFRERLVKVRGNTGSTEAKMETYVDVNYLTITAPNEFALTRAFMEMDPTRSIYKAGDYSAGYSAMKQLTVFPHHAYAYVEKTKFDAASKLTDISDAAGHPKRFAAVQLLLGALASTRLEQYGLVDALWVALGEDMIADKAADKEKDADKTPRTDKTMPHAEKVMRDCVHLLLPDEKFVIELIKTAGRLLEGELEEYCKKQKDTDFTETRCELLKRKYIANRSPRLHAFWAWAHTHAEDSSQPGWKPEFIVDGAPSCQKLKARKLDGKSCYNALAEWLLGEFLPRHAFTVSGLLQLLQVMKTDKEFVERGNAGTFRGSMPAFEVDSSEEGRLRFHVHVALFQRNQAKPLRDAIKELGCFVTKPRKVLALLNNKLEWITLTPDGSGKVRLDNKTPEERVLETIRDPECCDLVDVELNPFTHDADEHMEDVLVDKATYTHLQHSASRQKADTIELSEDLETHGARLHLEHQAVPYHPEGEDIGTADFARYLTPLVARHASIRPINTANTGSRGPTALTPVASARLDLSEAYSRLSERGNENSRLSGQGDSPKSLPEHGTGRIRVSEVDETTQMDPEEAQQALAQTLDDRQPQNEMLLPWEKVDDDN